MRTRAVIVVLSLLALLLTGCTAEDPRHEIEVATEATITPVALVTDDTKQALRRWRKARTFLESGRTDPAPTHRHRAVGHCLRPTMTYPECALNPCSAGEGAHLYSIQESRLVDATEWSHVTTACLEDPGELLASQ